MNQGRVVASDQNAPVKDYRWYHEDRRWLYGTVAAVALGLAVVAGIVFMPGLTTKVVPGVAVANDREVAAAAADRKSADDAAAAQKAADDAAAFLAAAEATTKDSMQEYFDDPSNNLQDYGRITVYSVSLISVGQNRFEGMAECAIPGGPHKQIVVHVIADGQNVQWSTDKGGLVPLIPN